MKELNTKFGKLYIEELGNLEESDRIKIYDSNKKYLDYWGLYALEEIAGSHGITNEEYLESRIKKICECQEVNRFFNICLALTYESIQLGIDSLKLYLGWSDMADGEFDYEEQDYVNRIGDYYIVVKE